VRRDGCAPLLTRAAARPPARLRAFAQKEDAAIEALKKTFSVLDKVLESRTFLVGNSVTLADIVMACNLFQGMKNLFDAKFRAAFPSLCRYYATLANQPQFVKVLGEFSLCEKTMVFTAAKKEDKPKAAPAAEKPKPAPKKADDDGDDDGEPAAEKPKKNPLDDLPKSKMVFDSWKRLYSNTPAAQFKTICCPGLWNGADIPGSPTNEHFEGYDPEGYSVWFIEHKYPQEQTVQFKALNAVSGMFQRCDYARKYAFSVMSILHDKETNTYPIRGFWIFRGQDVNWQMKEECDDLEVYTLTKVDHNDPKVRERIASLLCEEETIDGLTNVEAKVYK
jgi:elongation factor 1-gamma